MIEQIIRILKKYDIENADLAGELEGAIQAWLTHPSHKSPELVVELLMNPDEM